MVLDPIADIFESTSGGAPKPRIIDVDPQTQQESVRQYEQAMESTPEQEYQKRMDDLNAPETKGLMGQGRAAAIGEKNLAEFKSQQELTKRMEGTQSTFEKIQRANNSLRAIQAIKRENQERLWKAEANRRAARNAVIKSILGMAGTVAGYAAAGPGGGMAGGQMAGSMAGSTKTEPLEYGIDERGMING